MSQKVLNAVKTTRPTTNGLKRDFYLFDASKAPIGRIATEAARILMGKHKETFSQDVNMGDIVVIINASQAVLTGKKSQKKNYFRYSGNMGGMKVRSFKEQQEVDPRYPLYHAIRGMIPKNRYRDIRTHQLLHIYPGNHDMPNKMIEVTIA